MRGRCWVVIAAVSVRLLSSDGSACADESGVSFWLPGQYGSFAATPLKPGWSFDTTFYYTAASATANARFLHGGKVELGASSPSELLMFTPTYAFTTPVLGGQLELGMTALAGRNSTSVTSTLIPPNGPPLSGSRSDELFAFGDLTPTAALKWNRDAQNFMIYATANVPVGAYDPNRLAALGIGHWAADAGAGYTYYSETAGLEYSAVLGLTYNFVNPDTQYRNGIDAHLDWAVSPYVSDKMHWGAAGYFYQQLTGDSGAGASLGDFKSRVIGIGPQIGFFIPMAAYQGYLNLRAYYEFAAKNRMEGWNAFVSFSIEPSEARTAKRAVR